MDQRTIQIIIRYNKSHLILQLLLVTLHEDVPLLVLAALVLEPDPDDPRAEPRHLDELVPDEGVRARARRVARVQRV